MTKLMVKNNSDNEIMLKISDGLKSIIENNSEIEQCLSVQALGYFSNKQSLKILLQQLRNPDEDVRSDAGIALGILKDKNAIPLLIENLIQDPVGEAKVIYIEALKALNAYESANLLCVLVSTRGEEENVAWEEDSSGWDDWLDVQRAAIITLGSFGEKIDVKNAIKAINIALNDSEGQNLWAMAVKILIRFGKLGVKSLIDLIGEASALNRKRIILALGDSELKESEDLLEAAMKDPDITVRMAAITSGANRGLSNICTLGLEDGSIDVRVKILQEYKNLTDNILSVALEDISPKVQIAACNAIIKDNKARPNLKLIHKAEILLRKDSDNLLSVLINAIWVAKSKGAAEFIEDIVNHSATSFKARLASLKALGELKSKNSVVLLSKAAADDNFEIRLAAIGALGKIAKNEGELAQVALEILSSAIAGDLVAIPENWQPEEDNIVDFEKHKNQKLDDDQDSRKIQIDREGNIIDAPLKPVELEIDALEKIQDEVEPPIPMSTLEAIMAANVDVPSVEDNIKIDEADIAFLEMTGTAPKKRKRLNPENTTPAHIDVRRLAALVACETGKQQLVEPLLKAISDSDKLLCEAGLDALTVLGSKGIDISLAQRVLLRHATTSEVSLSFRAIRALAFINSNIVTKVITKLCGDDNDIIRAEAIKASRERNIEIDYAEICLNGKRKTRLEAAKLIALSKSSEAVPALFAFAYVEDGVHKKLAADLLKNHQHHAFEVIKIMLEDDDAHKRLIGLHVLNYILQANSEII